MENKTALITGGSRGLGRSMALHLASKDVDVVLTYLNNVDAAEMCVAEIQALGGRAVALQLDTSSTDGFAEFADRFGAVLRDTWGRDRFDFLVNNAGIGMHAALSEIKPDQFDQLMNLHVKAVVFLTQHMLPMISPGGRILNVSSGLTRFSLPGFGVYAAMKGAVEVLSRYMAQEFAAQGITVNTIAPGAIETDFGGGAVRDNADLNAFVASNTALGRAGLPDDIGACVADLLTGGHGWMTGQRIEVSGGMFL